MRIIITSQYGTLSRGRHSARQGNGSAAQWAARDGRENLIIDAAGAWQLHCADGFRRTARATLRVDADGSYTMTGDCGRFTVLSATGPAVADKDACAAACGL